MDETSRILIYKLLHLAGLMSLFTGVSVLMIQGKDGSLRKPALIFHGVGLFLLLLGGFGMMARYHYSYSSGWFILKLVVWLFFGVSIVLAKKGVLKSKAGWIVCILAGVLAAWAGLYKPF